MPLTFLMWLIATLLGTAVLAVTLVRMQMAQRVIYCIALAISILLLTVVLSYVGRSFANSHLTLPVGLPWLGAHFRLDALAAFFLIIVNLGGASASLYGIGYGRHEVDQHRVLPFFPLFLAGMNLVVLADDAFTFLLSWEFMSLSSWALVIAHHREEDNTQAGYVYVVMASFGTFALLLAFGLLAGPEGNYAFDAMRGQNRTPLWTGVLLALVLLGTGSKAGLVPLHVWLPLAHPAAPSHVSALMSGVMTKVAIYGFVRIVFDLLGPAGWWWSIPVLAAGGGTAVMGVLYALMQHDLKRLLAYHTVENVGIIFIGLGLALAFKAFDMAPAAALALTAGLLHVFNHSIFKSLLFFGSGAVLTATGERDIEHLGGLIHRMPWTALYFLVGCVAISAFPPLNGFVSEWLTFQAILLSPELPSWGLKLLVPTVGGLLALSAALAAACFVKAFGITFLGRARTAAAEAAQETDRWSLAAMSILAALCLIAGVVPGLFIDAIAPVVMGLVGDRLPSQLSQPWLSLVPIAESRSSYNGLLVFVFITASASLTAFVIHRLASRDVRRGAAWGCGFPNPGPKAQYTAGSFSQPIRMVFGTYVFRAREHVEMRPPGDLAPAKFQAEIHDLAWELIYTPVATAVSLAATRLNQLQFLTIRRYLSFVFSALVILLLVLALWR